jgi:hypothetical protein
LVEIWFLQHELLVAAVVAVLLLVVVADVVDVSYEVIDV